MSYRPEQMREELRTAAEAVQRANRLTVAGYTRPGEHYDAVGALVELVGRVPQFTEHVRRCLRRADAESHFSDDGRPLAEVLTEADADLTDAIEHLEIASRALAAAWSGVGHLAYDPFLDDQPDNEADDDQPDNEADDDQPGDDQADGDDGGPGFGPVVGGGA